jgi:hypothetical protein
MEKLVVALSAIAIAFGVYAVGHAVDDNSATPVVAAVAAGSPSALAASSAAPAAAGSPTVATGSPGDVASGAGSASASEAAPHTHDGTTAVDDRGFSLLENGVQHSHAFEQPVSPADRVELARQLTLTREVALQYPTVKDAEAAGMRRAGPFSPGLGAHYINFRTAASSYNIDGVMSDDDIRHPLAYIYDGTDPDSHIAGLFYMSGDPNLPEGFAGPNDVWHTHSNICIKPGADGVIDAPLGADHDATVEQCKAVGGNLLKQTMYLLHVWSVPGYESADGVFSHLSPGITCADGTYHVVDYDKLGTRKSACVDSSE